MKYKSHNSFKAKPSSEQEADPLGTGRDETAGPWSTLGIDYIFSHHRHFSPWLRHPWWARLFPGCCFELHLAKLVLHLYESNPGRGCGSGAAACQTHTETQCSTAGQTFQPPHPTAAARALPQGLQALSTPWSVAVSEKGCHLASVKKCS